jgi:ankyrin repeat protein
MTTMYQRPRGGSEQTNSIPTYVEFPNNLGESLPHLHNDELLSGSKNNYNNTTDESTSLVYRIDPQRGTGDLRLHQSFTVSENKRDKPHLRRRSFDPTSPPKKLDLQATRDFLSKDKLKKALIHQSIRRDSQVLALEIEDEGLQATIHTVDFSKSHHESALDLLSLLGQNEWKKLRKTLTNLQETAGNATVRRVLMATTKKRKETPLHVAVWKAPPHLTLAMFELLLLQSPDDCKDVMLQKDVDGNTPLHLACANVQDASSKFTVIRNALLLAPQALEMANLHGDTPLHLLVASKAFSSCKEGSDATAAEQAVASLLLMAPVVATRQNKNGLTLLHVAIANQAQEQVILKLLKIAPQAAQIADCRGMLPLHYVAAFFFQTRNISMPTVEKLLRAEPDGIYSQTMEGDTPLHLLMSNARQQIKKDGVVDDHSTAELVELLIGAISVTNNEGLSPLHVCVLFDTPLDLVRLVMEVSPIAATKASALTTPQGDTALHLACKRKYANEKLVKVLTTSKACCTKDRCGRTPLEVALQSKKFSSSVVKSLLLAYQASPECRRRRRSKKQSQRLSMSMSEIKVPL